MSAVMAQTGATFEQSLGMLTAITEVTRNASKASRGLVSIGSRLVQIVDDSSSTGQALKEIYTELGIELFNSEGQLRSSYEIFSDLAQIWDTLDTNTQNYIASQQAGTNQFQNFAALMDNFGTATEATATALNSAGSAARENSRYMESLEAKTQQLKATFQDLANNVIESELVKSILDLTNGFLELTNSGIGPTIVQWGLLAGVLTGGITLFSEIAVKLAGMLTGITKVISVLKGASGFVGLLSSLSSVAAPVAVVLSALAVGGYAIYKAYKQANPTLEELNSNLDDYNAQLETNNQRLEELSEIPIISRTSAIQEEIDALKEENETLKENIALTQEQIGEKLTTDIQNKKEYLTSKTGYDISSKDYSFSASSIEEATMQLEYMEGVEDSVKEKAAQINEEFSKTNGIVTDDILILWEQIQDELQNSGATIEEFNSGYNSFDASITQLVERYKELAYQVENGEALTAEEREEFLNLQTTLQNLYDDLGDVKDAQGQLSGASNVVYGQLEQLIPNFEDLSMKAWNLGDNVNSTNYYLGLLSSGFSLNKSQIDLLSQSFPTLNEYLSENNGLYQLNIDALYDAAEAGNVWATQLIEQQKTATQATLEYSEARLDALVQEAKAMGQQYGYESEAYLKAKESAVAALDEIHAIQNTLTRINVGLPSLSLTQGDGDIEIPDVVTGGDGGNSAQKENDILKERQEIYQDQVDIMEHQLFLMEKQNASESDRIAYIKQIQDYLHKQADWYRAQGESEDSEYIRDLQEQWWSYYDDIIDLQRESFDDRLKESEDYIEEHNKLANWGADSEIEAWNRVLKWMDEWYKQGLVDYEYYIEKRQEALDNLIEAEKDALENQIDIYETLFSTVASKAQEEIDALEEERTSVEDYWNAKIDALQQANDELDEQIEKEEALDALARARQTKVMVYKDGRFQYINDIDEVSEAQANLEKIKRDEILQEEIANLEELRDKELASIDEQIKGWEEYKEEWASVVDDYEEKQNELLLQQELGITLEGENWRERLDNLESYVDEYENLMNRLNNLEGQEISQPSKVQSSSKPSIGGTVGTVIGSTIGSIVSGGIGTAVGGIAGNIIGNLIGSATKHANGTLSTNTGIKLVGEKGPELQITPSGDGIIPYNKTKNLWEWGNFTPNDYANILKSGNNISSHDRIINIQNLNLPEVKSAQDFINYLTNNIWQRTVQFVD